MNYRIICSKHKVDFKGTSNVPLGLKKMLSTFKRNVF